MPSGIYTFPNNFLWGTATAALQVEGRNQNSTWSAWEGEAGRIMDGNTAGLACDWWGGRWREDFNRAEAGGQNAHRLSIAWSRIQPAPDRWDENALDRYRELLIGLRSRKMTPMVTLHHFSEPLWLAEMGGWENEAIIEYFTSFVKKAVEALMPYCNLWVTINEPNVYMIEAFVEGLFPPGKKDMKAALLAMQNMIRAHAQAYAVIHELQSDARVGSSINYRGFAPASGLPWDHWAARVHHVIFNDLFPRTLKDGVFNAVIKRERILEAVGTQDFLGINYYTTDWVRFAPFARKEIYTRRFFPPGAELSDSGFIANIPEGMTRAVIWGDQFGVPIFITENGVDDSRDNLRPRYTLEHLHALWQVLNNNHRVEGYFHWTLVDNFEWERGWSQHFGLWGLDRETQARIKRPSADMYAAICQANGISSETVEKYAPELMDKLFP